MGKPPVSSPKRQSAPTVVEAPSCGEEPKVDPRVKRTRKLLEDALRELMNERAYGEIAIGDIADRATVNRATFYAHFEDKAHLAATLMRDDLHRALVARLQPPAPFDREALVRVGAAFFEFFARFIGGCRKHADEGGAALGTTLQDTLEAFLNLWLEHHPEGLDRFPGAASGTVANVLAWGLYGAAVRWSRLARRPPAEDAAREAVALLMR